MITTNRTRNINTPISILISSNNSIIFFGSSITFSA